MGLGCVYQWQAMVSSQQHGWAVFVSKCTGSHVQTHTVSELFLCLTSDCSYSLLVRAVAG